MSPSDLPLAVRLPLAAAAVGLAWWRFGSRNAARRRPAVVVLTGFAAAWLAFSGEGLAYLLRRDGVRWWPVVLVGAACTWPAVRGRWAGRTFDRPTRLCLGAAGGVMAAAPFLALAEQILAAQERTETALAGAGGGVLVGVLVNAAADAPGAAVVGAVCGLFAAAALRSQPDPAGGDGP